MANLWIHGKTHCKNLQFWHLPHCSGIKSNISKFQLLDIVALSDTVEKHQFQASLMAKTPSIPLCFGFIWQIIDVLYNFTFCPLVLVSEMQMLLQYAFTALTGTPHSVSNHSKLDIAFSNKRTKQKFVNLALFFGENWLNLILINNFTLFCMKR